MPQWCSGLVSLLIHRIAEHGKCGRAVILDKYTREDGPPRKVPDRDGNQETAAVYGRIQSESGAGEPATGYHD